MPEVVRLGGADLTGHRVILQGISVFAGSSDAALKEIGDLVEQRLGGYVCFSGAHGMSEGYRDAEVLQAHQEATLVMPDGVPLVWWGRSHGHEQMEQIAGPAFLPRLLSHAGLHRWRVFFFGADVATLGKAAERAEANFPGLVICGTHSPPFGHVADWDNAHIREMITAARADLVLVGLSTPTQELWMHLNSSLLARPVLLGFGAALNILAGVQRDAPAVIRGSGLEWAYRLFSEPRRLWRRYARSIPIFLWILVRDRSAGIRIRDRSTAPKSSSRSVQIVGPTPPPYGGQAVMIQALLDSRSKMFPDYQWSVAPVRFSRGLAENGKFRARKLWHLFSLISRVISVRLSQQPRILYYSPAGPTTLPVLRDIVVLCIIRPMFPLTIFHFHAGGVSHVYTRLPTIARYFYRRAYWNADLGIKVSKSAPDDPANLRARATLIIPNGVHDLAAGRRALSHQGVPRILFVGLLRESKGVLVLVKALQVLAGRDLRPALRLVGELESDAFADTLRARIDEYGLAEQVVFSGVLVGEAKADAYEAADILCFPTFFESETFGLVAVEAMTFGLPVVATRWRGLVDVVEHEQTGLLVSPGDPSGLADALERLITNPEEARLMGSRGRTRYEQLFTINRHLEAMRGAFESLADPEGTLSTEKKSRS